ncbi:MAG: hypothetical protein ACTIC1_01375 [Brevibacterium sp.]
MNDFAKPNVYDDRESLELIREHLDHRRSLGALCISRSAAEQGAELVWLSNGHVWATLADRRIPIVGHYGPESPVATGIAGDKTLAKRLMLIEGTSVPAGRNVTSADDAIAAQMEIDRPIVIKPANGAMGRGVTVNVSTAEEVRDAYLRARKAGSRVLVEQYVEGTREYRAHATPDECVGLFRRIIPSVTGDGASTVRQLIEQKNRIRGHNPTTAGFPIKMDEVAEVSLRRQGHTWNSVPAAGEVVVAREVNGITSGGDSEECLASAPADLKDAAVSAVRAIPGLTWGGVDILVEGDTGTPYVLEVNCNASINGSTFPVYGTPRDLGSRLWKEIVKKSAPDPIAEPMALPLAERPHRLGSEMDALAPDTMSLHKYLMITLQLRGYRTNNLNELIWTAEQAAGPQLWFSTVMSGADVARTIHPIRRPLALRQILQKGSLPRPYSRTVATDEQLRAFMTKVGDSVELRPLTSGLGRATRVIIGPGDEIPTDIFAKKRSWYAQSRRPGLRFSVIASRDAVLVVLVQSAQDECNQDVLNKVTKLAVRAVRAVPQLRWGVVEIVHQQELDRSGRKVETMVEGITLNPTVSTADTVIAGSMDNFVTLVVNGALSAADGPR